jgi:uncharacterized protein YbaP (TraB family)
MHKRSSWWGLVGLVIAAALVSVPASSDEGEAPVKARFPESTSLWKVEGDSSVVYLLGSIHLLKQEDLPFHPKMEEVFQEAETLVFEIELDSARTPAFQQYMFFTALYESGKTLQTELGDSLYHLLGEYMASVGIEIQQMNQFEPWMVTLTIVALKLQQLGLDPDFGVDSYFYSRAQAAGKEVLALETPQYQVDLFDSLSASDQKNLVLQMLEQTEDIEEMLAEIIRYWKTGNLDGLEATMNKSFAEFPELRQFSLSNRNLNWIRAIEEYLSTPGEYLVIVGVAHMAGEDGLINLLQQAGYRVQQM